MTTGRRLFCKELLCFNTVPCRHMPLLVHFSLSRRDRRGCGANPNAQTKAGATPLDLAKKDPPSQIGTRARLAFLVGCAEDEREELTHFGRSVSDDSRASEMFEHGHSLRSSFKGPAHHLARVLARFHATGTVRNSNGISSDVGLT